ncbi:MAG: hypothetical protein IPM97_12025 [Bdellovibrionaceae bacterium]|nr:hypothetical protein [Pseudobdellovibrionaceae bacterium]
MNLFTLNTLLIAIIFNFASFALAKTQVIYIGGHKSTQKQMQDWQNMANNNKEYSAHFEFRAEKLPATMYQEQPVIESGKSMIDDLAHKIDGDKTSDEYILVGHSSGSAISNKVAELVKNKKRIKLVVLDGFKPTKEVINNVDTYCWSAVSAEDQNQKSLYHDVMQSCQNPRTYKPHNCNTPWCLHFSLVNKGAIQNNIDKNNYGKTGYDNLDANLSWMHEFKPQTRNPGAGGASAGRY